MTPSHKFGVRKKVDWGVHVIKTRYIRCWHRTIIKTSAFPRNYLTYEYTVHEFYKSTITNIYGKINQHKITFENFFNGNYIFQSSYLSCSSIV